MTNIISEKGVTAFIHKVLKHPPNLEQNLNNVLWLAKNLLCHIEENKDYSSLSSSEFDGVVEVLTLYLDEVARDLEAYRLRELLF